MTIALGSEVRDTITGFTGIVTARTSYITGCDRYSVQPPLDKDGKYRESYAFDEPLLEVLKPPPPKPNPLAGVGAG